jgi:2-polyprenyl-3-methyl-5-hydroxy-6-metoxy-1,4-benzoquinol methylase
VQISVDLPIACNLCGGNEPRLLYPNTLSNDDRSGSVERFRCTSCGYGRHHAIVRCARCGLVYASPRAGEEDISHSYEEVVDDLYVEERRGRVLTFERNFRPLAALMSETSKPRLLDVGCYVGIFLEIAAEHGWEAWGVEPSHWAAEEARRRHLNVVNGTLSSAEFPPHSFDVVTLWDVIEHLTDPKGDLQHISRILKPGGLVCIHTIDIGSLLPRILGPRWPWLMEMHLYYFCRRTLALLLEQTGFQVVRQFTQGRYVLLDYLLTQSSAVSPGLSRILRRAAQRLGIAQCPIPVNLGDLFTTFARKVADVGP